MSARIVFVIINILNLIWRWVRMYIAKVQRLRPLPEEIADIYDKDRYQMFLDYEADTDRLFFYRRLIDCIVDTAFILSPIFRWLEHMAGQNVYLIVAVTLLMYTFLNLAIEIPFDYYDTFTIAEKYKLNKQTRKTFVKDTISETVFNTIMAFGVLELITYLSHGLSSVSTKSHMSYTKSFFVALLVFAVVFVIILAIAFTSILLMHIKYKYTPLEEGDLRDKINYLQRDAKKKVRRISVYDESSKSIEKNAYLLRFLFYREFGIADNFINENSERELLAVLSHEVGHLKHKKKPLDYARYLLYPILFFCIWYTLAMPMPSPGDSFLEKWIMESFQITVPNYFLLVTLVIGLGQPVMALVGIIRNYRQRQEEYEADQEAVKNGYGEDMIKIFKEESNDELIDINPHPIMVVLYHSHPTMYQRIVAIRREICRMEPGREKEE